MTDRRWRKSTYSGNAQGECVEVGFGDGLPVGVRDTKNPGPEINLPAEAWQALMDSVRGSMHD